MIVIPMAGLSRRFREAGYSAPKYELELHGRSVFNRAVSSFKAYSKEPFLFIAREECNVERFIYEEARSVGLTNVAVVLLPTPTLGQADTVAQGLSRRPPHPDEPLTIFNIDTFRPGFRRPDAAWLKTAAGYLEVTHATDPGLSYVRPEAGGHGRVAETAEKVVISDLASTGLYHFRNTALFQAAMEKERARPHSFELFIAPMYNHLIADGYDVRYWTVSSEEVVSCGTPEQYNALLQDNLV